MKRAVKASVDSDVQTILDLAKEGRNWQDMAFLKGSGKDVWYTIVKTKGVMPDGTPARLMVDEYIGNYDTGLYFERDFFTNVNGLLSKLSTPVVVERESDGNIFLEGHKRYNDRQSANSSTRSNMKKVVRGSRGTAQDLINALNNRIDDIQDGTVASTQVTGTTEEFEDRIVDSVIDRLGDEIVDVNTDKLLDVLYDIDPDMKNVYDISRSQWESVVDKCREGAVEEDNVEYQYSIEDTHGTPQAGLEVLDFETWDELQEYLDENPDVQERVEEGYATIKEL